jgi:TolA-binding protein
LQAGDIITQRHSSGTWATPNGYAALFSRAECHMRLGEYAIAEQQFNELIGRFPQHRGDLEKFRDLARSALPSR